MEVKLKLAWQIVQSHDSCLSLPKLKQLYPDEPVRHARMHGHEP